MSASEQNHLAASHAAAHERLKKWAIFREEQLLLRQSGLPKNAPTRGEGSGLGVELLPGGDVPPLPASGMIHSLGAYGGVEILAYELKNPYAGTELALSGLRGCYDFMERGLYDLLGRGRQLIHWDQTSRFCPACGTSTLPHTGISKKCPECGREFFPQVPVAILALLRRDDKILLVRAHNFKGSFYGLVAGFLEPGESLEECVAREVLEETGLTALNIRYIDSQPWPYPAGMMVGFSADCAEGDIRLQEEELAEAAFYGRGELPELPNKLSLTRQMIDLWLEGKI